MNAKWMFVSVACVSFAAGGCCRATRTIGKDATVDDVRVPAHCKNGYQVTWKPALFNPPKSWVVVFPPTQTPCGNDWIFHPGKATCTIPAQLYPGGPGCPNGGGACYKYAAVAETTPKDPQIIMDNGQKFRKTPQLIQTIQVSCLALAQTIVNCTYPPNLSVQPSSDSNLNMIDWQGPGTWNVQVQAFNGSNLCGQGETQFSNSTSPYCVVDANSCPSQNASCSYKYTATVGAEPVVSYTITVTPAQGQRR